MNIKKYVLLFLLSICFPAYSVSDELSSQTPAKYVILVIGDAMHLTHETAASRFLTGTGRGLVWHTFEYQTFVTTWDINTYNHYAKSLGKPPYAPESFDPNIGYDPLQGGARPYPLEMPLDDSYFLDTLNERLDNLTFSDRIPATDSAASATAMATGTKVYRGTVAWHGSSGKSGALPSICETLRQHGAAIGIVTSDPFCHATPAAFVSHNRDRMHYYSLTSHQYGIGIADEILAFTRPDVVISGGHPHLNNPKFKPRKGYISKRLYEQMKQSAEYVFVEYKPEHNGALELKNAAERAVREKKKLFGLFGEKNGCIPLPQVQSDNDTISITMESTEHPSLADAAVAALTVLRTHPRGFFLMVEQGGIDHSNGTNNYRNMIRAVCDLNTTVCAIIDFVNQPDDELDWDTVLLVVTSDHAGGYIRFNKDIPLKKGILPEQKLEKGKWVFPNKELSYGTKHHTNELVSLYAKGARTAVFAGFEGKWYPHTRIIDNTHIYHALKQAASVK